MAIHYPKATDFEYVPVGISECEDIVDLVERNASMSADDFLAGKKDWFLDDILGITCLSNGFDYDEAWLMTRVLFEPAVYYKLTGKVK